MKARLFCFLASALVATLLIVVSTHSVNATTIRALSLDKAAKQAQLIFQGQVIDSQTRWNQAKTDIQTIVTFKVDEIIKGDYKDDTLQLVFSGGEVGQDKVLYSGMVYPDDNESGIYFVESLDKALLNPLIGWSQGHFKLQNKGNTDTIMTNRNQPIMSITPLASNQTPQFSEGVVSGIELGKIGQTGMNSADFKRAIKRMINNN